MLDDVLSVTKKIKVLYVEDEEETRNSMLLVLNNFFEHIDIAENGKEALEKFIKNDYDLIITDITMPYMNGIDLMNKVKQLNPEVKVIILSAHNDKENILEAIEEEADGFLLKPLNVKKLILLLKKMIVHIKLKLENDEYKKNLENLVEKKSKELLENILIDKITQVSNCAKLEEDIGNQEKYIIVIDLSNFRKLNSAFGIEFGDNVLYELAQYLKYVIPEKTKLYRCKSSDFAYLVDSNDKSYIQKILEDLEEKLSKFFINKNDITIFFTFKVVAVKGIGRNLIHKAELAIEDLKSKNMKNTYQIFNEKEDIVKNQKNKIIWINKTIKAIKNNMIEPFFQAIVDNKTQKVEKYEVLARMIDGDKIISPYFFIDVSEEAGLLQEITKIIIKKAFKKIANTDIQISINISEADLDLGYLEEFLREELKLNNLKATQITLEVLEGISSNDISDNLNQLLRFKSLGFVLAIDDFGTGFSNFERVYKMQPDFIKIDGVFIKDIDKNENSKKISEAIKMFSTAIGAKVIAEFVSSKEVFDVVKEMDIDYSQGYYFSEPSKELLEL